MTTILEELDKLAPLAAAATQKEWFADLRSGVGAVRTEVCNGLCGDEDDVIVASRRGSTYVEGPGSHWTMDEQAQKNLAFIASACNFVRTHGAALRETLAAPAAPVAGNSGEAVEKQARLLTSAAVYMEGLSDFLPLRLSGAARRLREDASTIKEIALALSAPAATGGAATGQTDGWLDPSRGPVSVWEDSTTQILTEVVVHREGWPCASTAFYCDANEDWFLWKQDGSREIIHDVLGWQPMPALPTPPHQQEASSHAN